MRREKSNIAPKYAVYRAYASDTSGTNFSTTQSDTLPFMAEYLSEYVIEPSKVNAALFAGKWVRYIPSVLGLLPETVLVSVDSAGDNPDLPITVTTSLNIGIEDDIANWTITVEDETDCTATVVSKNVRVDTLTADTGTLTVVANKTGYDEITKTLTIKKVYDGADGVGVIVTPSTIHIPCNWAGLEPVYTNALSTMIVTVGNTDDTTNWAFAVQSVSNVTAAIQNDDEVAVSAITADEGSITVRASRSGFSNIDVLIPVKKIYAGENGTTDDYDDVTIGKDGLGDLYVKDGGITAEKLEYKEFVGIYTFTGSGGTPTLTILKNTLGIVPTTERYAEGGFLLNAASTFILGKTFVITNNVLYNGGATCLCDTRTYLHYIQFVMVDMTSVMIDPINNEALQIMIRVYP